MSDNNENKPQDNVSHDTEKTGLAKITESPPIPDDSPPGNTHLDQPYTVHYDIRGIVFGSIGRRNSSRGTKDDDGDVVRKASRIFEKTTILVLAGAVFAAGAIGIYRNINSDARGSVADPAKTPSTSTDSMQFPVLAANMPLPKKKGKKRMKAKTRRSRTQAASQVLMARIAAGTSV